MTTDLSAEPQLMNAELELAQALESQAAEKQKAGDSEQIVTPGVEAQPDSSSTSSETTEPSSNPTQPSKADLLATLTIDEIQSHPTLSKDLQSLVDKSAAKKLEGKTREIESRVRAEMEFERDKKFFESLEKDKLGELLANNPDAAKRYGQITNAPTSPSTPPPTEEVGVQVRYFANQIASTNKRLAALPEEVRKTLDPNVHLQAKDGDDPAEILSAWVDKVNEAVITASKTTPTKAESESERLEREAAEDASKPGGAITENGLVKGPIPDINALSGEQLLEDAIRRTSKTSRR